MITPVLSIYLSTTTTVFTPVGHVNILHDDDLSSLYVILMSEYFGRQMKVVSTSKHIYIYICVCVCVRARVCMYVCVCLCVWNILIVSYYWWPYTHPHKQTNQFIISTQFSSILPIDKTQSSTTTPARVCLRAIKIKGYSIFPTVSTLLELHPQIVLYDMQYICWGNFFLSRDAVGVFYSRLGMIFEE